MLSVQQFLTKNSMTPVPHPPVHLILPRTTFFSFPQMKKLLRGKYFANVEEVKQKTAKALKGIKIDKFKNCFEQWKNVSKIVFHQTESTLKVSLKA